MCCALLVFQPAPSLAIDDIGLTNRVWLQGVINVEVSDGFQNEGVLRLETIDDAYTITLIVNGVVTNNPPGTVEIRPGAGGGRIIVADWINEGLFQADYSADLSRSNGFFLQRGAFNIAANQRVLLYNTNGFVNQEHGSLKIDGRVEIKEAAFNYTGGIIQGTPHLINCVLQIAPSITNSVSITFNGPASTLVGDVLSNHFLKAEGTPLDGPGILGSPSGFRNAGRISLDSTNAAVGSSLKSPGGAITNLASGVIDVESGAGGERAIHADLINLGKIHLQTDLQIVPTSGSFTNQGSIEIDADQNLWVGTNYDQNETAVLKLGLSQPEPGFTREFITVPGVARLEGTLQITLPEDYLPAPLDQFVLLRTQTRLGSFSTVLMPSLPPGRFWNFDYAGDSVALSVSDSFLKPSLKGFRLLSSGALHLFFTGSVGGGIYLDSSTNLVDWSRVRTNRPFNGFMEIIETNLSRVPQRFYRIVPTT